MTWHVVRMRMNTWSAMAIQSGYCGRALGSGGDWYARGTESRELPCMAARGGVRADNWLVEMREKYACDCYDPGYVKVGTHYSGLLLIPSLIRCGRNNNNPMY
jgi:hypothetical protein